jgi:hypothetical protein
MWKDRTDFKDDIAYVNRIRGWISALAGVASGWAGGQLLGLHQHCTRGRRIDSVGFTTPGFSAYSRGFWLDCPWRYWTLMFLRLSAACRPRLCPALAGVLMIGLFFGFSLSTACFWFSGLAFMTSAISMLVYAALAYRLPVRG